MTDVGRQAFEAIRRRLDVGRELGVDVELDVFLKDGWRWEFVDGVYRLWGPRKGNIQPGIRSIKHAIAYGAGCIWFRHDAGTDMLTWRDDGFGFVVQFRREPVAHESSNRPSSEI